jgi:hypothetical protein
VCSSAFLGNGFLRVAQEFITGNNQRGRSNQPGFESSEPLNAEVQPGFLILRVIHFCLLYHLAICDNAKIPEIKQEHIRQENEIRLGIQADLLFVYFRPRA